MHVAARIRLGVPRAEVPDVSSVAAEFAELFPAAYLRFHVRRRKQSELSAQSRAVLAHLELSGPLTVSEAAEHMSRAQSVMSEILLGLEKKKLVMRFTDARDRRRTLVALTDEGQERLAADRRVLDPSLVARALATMSTRERAELIRGMRALMRAANLTPPTKNEQEK